MAVQLFCGVLPPGLVHFLKNKQATCILWHINLCVLFNAKSCLYIYIYIEREREMVGFGKSYKMIKIRGKVDKPNTYNGFRSIISVLIQGSWISSSLNKERNITTFPLIYIYIYIYIPKAFSREGFFSKPFLASLTGFNSEFSFSYTGCYTKINELVCPIIYP